MNRVTSLFAALGIVAAAASPAWAHHYHSYYHGYHRYYGYGYGVTVGAPYASYGYSSGCSSYLSQADAYADQGNYDAAIAAYTQAIAVNPNCAVAYNNRGAAWDAKNEFDKGIADTNQALAINPSYVEAYVSRGALWYNKSEYDKAIADDNQALAINPSYAQAYDNRANAWNLKGDYEKAKSDFNQALAIEADNPAFLTDLAFFQATCMDARYRDAKQAFANASKAYQLYGGNNVGGIISVLASVYAENGDYPKAIEWQTKAFDETKSDEMKQRYLARLSLFKQGKPFHLDPKTAMETPSVVAKISN